MNTPTISLVVPCFNAAATIERTLKSIQDQAYPNLEVILMDGGSKDDTMSIVRRHEKLFAKIVSEKDNGQTSAINKGFRLATGEIFAWLCADDELAPGALQSAAGFFTENPDVDVLTCGCDRVFSDGTIVRTEPRPDTWERIGYHNGIEQPSTAWRAKAHRAAGELDESMHYAFDWEWWNRLRYSGARLAVTPRVCSRYHFSEVNKTSTGARKVVTEMYQVIKRYGPLRGYLADIYMFLYLRFDLYGCYDRPPTGGKTRTFFFKHTIRPLLKLFGRELIYSYNWNFASKQERGLVWWK